MKEELITFETAKLAKEKGFDWKVRQRYDDKELIYAGVLYNHNSKEEQELWNIELTSAPTQSLLQKWLREVHKIIVEITWQMCSTGYEYAVIDMNNPPRYEDEVKRIKGFKTYEESLEEGLYEVLKLI